MKKYHKAISDTGKCPLNTIRRFTECGDSYMQHDSTGALKYTSKNYPLVVYIGDIQSVPNCQFTQVHMMSQGDINTRQREVTEKLE